MDSIKIADDLAVIQSQASPEAALPAARDLCCRSTGLQALVAGTIPRHIDAAGAGQSRHSFLLCPHVDAEEICYLFSTFFGTNSAGTRQNLAFQQRFFMEC